LVQVTAPSLPHVDWAAQRTIAERQRLGMSSRFTALATHFT
jgi:hypothetical protein